MTLSEHEVLQTLMQARVRISAAAWLMVRNTHTAEDIFQNVAVKAMTRDLSFDGRSAPSNSPLNRFFVTLSPILQDWNSSRSRLFLLLFPDPMIPSYLRAFGANPAILALALKSLSGFPFPVR